MSSRTDETGYVDVLMYHSISSEPGPTSIAASTFREQMRSIADSGCGVVPFSSFRAWQRGELELPARAVMLTFDDGFADFADAAFPILDAHGFAATVFLPTGRLGGREDWHGANSPPRPLMSWDVVRDLAARGVEFGGHSVTHADLTQLSAAELRREIASSQAHIAAELGKPPTTFAPPYGHVNASVLREVALHAEVSAGTGLGRADRTSSAVDTPRIEMHYFRNGKLWRAYLQNRAGWYLRSRRLARWLRQQIVSRASPRSVNPSSPNV
jgi:peptidoglycan/xylan/chitin deacetylase (PgdA/CDA1 family)